MAVRSAATRPKTAFATAPTPHSLAGFDGLRAIAALLIICHHTGFVSGTTFRTRWGYYFTRMDIGVPVFFAISAFLLTRPFAAALLDDQPLPDRYKFWVRRLARIYPAYIVATIVILIGHGIDVRGGSGLFFSLSLTHIYHPGRFISGITQSWSLATELSFYLLLPLWAMFMRRWLAGRGVNRRALVLLGSIAILFASSFVFRLGFHAVLPTRWFQITRYWLPSLIDCSRRAWRSPCSACGHNGVRSSPMRPRSAGTPSPVGRVPWWCSGSSRPSLVSSGGLSCHRSRVRCSARRSTPSPASSSSRPSRSRGRRPSRILDVLDLPPIAGFGVVSYGVYLWHQYVLREVGSVMGWPLFSGHFWGLLLPTVAISALVGWVSWRVVERPALASRPGGDERAVTALVVMPAYNEEASLAATSKELASGVPSVDVLVVDDGSTDTTAATARKGNAAVLRLPFNLGVGGAVRAGLRYAVEHHYERAVVVDADGQHPPAAIEALLAALDGGADLAIGSNTYWYQ